MALTCREIELFRSASCQSMHESCGLDVGAGAESETPSCSRGATELAISEYEGLIGQFSTHAFSSLAGSYTAKCCS